MNAARRPAPTARVVSDVERAIGKYSAPAIAPAKTPAQELVPLSIRVTEDLRTRFRLACIEDHRKVQEVTAEIIAAWLKARDGRQS